MVRVLCTGITAHDTVLGVDTMPVGDGKSFANKCTQVVGGNAANASIAIGRLGAEPLLVTRIGNDVAGEAVVQNLTQAGVNIASVDWLNGVATSNSTILVDSQGLRRVINYSDPALFRGKPRLDDTRPDAVLTDTRWPEGAAASLELARSRGVPGVVDFDRVPNRQTAEMLFGLASHLAFGRDGLAALTGHDDIAQGLLAVAGRTRAWIGVTAGERGVFWLEDGRVHHLPAFKVAVVDTLGAGDVFHGAMALALAEGMNERDALTFSSAVAAIKCGQFGGGSVTPHRHEVEAFLRERQA